MTSCSLPMAKEALMSVSNLTKHFSGNAYQA